MNTPHPTPTEPPSPRGEGMASTWGEAVSEADWWGGNGGGLIWNSNNN